MRPNRPSSTSSNRNMMRLELLKHDRCIRLITATTHKLIIRRSYSQGFWSGPTRQRWFGIRIVGFTAAFLGAAYTYTEYFHDKLYPRTAFRRYKLEDKVVYSSTSSIFTMKAQESVDWSQEVEQGLWSVEIKQPQLQIAREYTPLPPASIGLRNHNISSTIGQQRPHRRDLLEFWIRKEPSGEMSNYLHKLDQGSDVEIRGPKSRTDIPDAREIVFLAGGTGIAPAFQLAHALLARYGESEDLPKLHVLWANRKREDCVGGMSDHVSHALGSGILAFFGFRSRSIADGQKSILVERLEKLKEAFHGKLQVDYFIDEEDSLITKQIILSRLNSTGNEDHNSLKRVIMVCGPDGFVNHFAGPREWRNGRQIQGQVTGALRDAGQLGWEVIKL